MKDFDQDRQARRDEGREARTFRLGGETFVVKPAIRPEALTQYENLKSEDSATKALETIDELVLAFLEPNDEGDDYEGRYRSVRARDDDPVGLNDLQDLVQWLVETQTGRPTGRPGNSSPGPGPTGDSSTADSSSRALQAV